MFITVHLFYSKQKPHSKTHYQKLFQRLLKGYFSSLHLGSHMAHLCSSSRYRDLFQCHCPICCNCVSHEKYYYHHLLSIPFSFFSCILIHLKIPVKVKYPVLQNDFLFECPFSSFLTSSLCCLYSPSPSFL